MLLKFTGFEIYGCALGILALQTFHPGQTALPFSRANVRPGIESILKKPQASVACDIYGLAPPQLAFQISPPHPIISRAR